MLLFLSKTDAEIDRMLGDDETILVIDPFVPGRADGRQDRLLAQFGANDAHSGRDVPGPPGPQ